MELELSQVGRRYASWRVTTPHRQARLVASLSQHGQQSPVLVVPGADGCFVLIDGYARVAALDELGRDLVEALVLEVSEPEAVILAHRLENKRRRSALEEGWMVAELVEGHGMSQREVASRLQRSLSWVSRRLALAKGLPDTVQEAVRVGVVPPHAAMKYLTVLARANTSHCERLVAGLGGTAVSVRQVERLYRGWRRADDPERERIVDHPWLFLKAAEAAEHTPAVPEDDPAAPLLDDLEGVSGLSRRARRRIREGILDQLDGSRRGLVSLTAVEARRSFDSLFQLLKECDHARPRHADSDPEACRTGAWQEEDRSSARGQQEQRQASAGRGPAGGPEASTSRTSR